MSLNTVVVVEPPARVSLAVSTGGVQEAVAIFLPSSADLSIVTGKTYGIIYAIAGSESLPVNEVVSAVLQQEIRGTCLVVNTDRNTFTRREQAEAVASKLRALFPLPAET